MCFHLKGRIINYIIVVEEREKYEQKIFISSKESNFSK